MPIEQQTNFRRHSKRYFVHLPALGKGFLASRAWHRIFTRFMFSRDWYRILRAWHGLHVFPRSAQNFTRLARVHVFPRSAQNFTRLARVYVFPRSAQNLTRLARVHVFPRSAQNFTRLARVHVFSRLVQNWGLKNVSKTISVVEMNQVEVR